MLRLKETKLLLGCVHSLPKELHGTAVKVMDKIPDNVNPDRSIMPELARSKQGIAQELSAACSTQALFVSRGERTQATKRRMPARPQSMACQTI